MTAIFASLFGQQPQVQADAPGRVNLIGEHTDYNGGYVLPTPIPQRTRVALSIRPNNTVRAVSTHRSGIQETYSLGREQPGAGWLDYVQGVTHLLRGEGHSLGGFDLLIESDVPLGSGLSSSAALTVSLMRGLRQAFALRLDDLAIAVLGRRVENEFVGAQVGIMDPMAVSLGQTGSALFIDTRTLGYERVPMPAEADLVVINSGVAHRHAAGDYNTRRRECEAACSRLGVQQLRDLSEADLPAVAILPAPLNQRARHVITENARVLATVQAFRAGDMAEAGRLFYASHVSQRDDYAVSIPEIDLLVDLARAEGSVFGARLTGGGFGGSVVMLASAGQGRSAAGRIATAYARQSGQSATILVPS